MRAPLTEEERQDLSTQLVRAHNTISAVTSDLRSRYTSKATVVKSAQRAERAVFQLKRQLDGLSLSQAPGTNPLPEVRQGQKTVNIEELRGVIPRPRS